MARTHQTILPTSKTLAFCMVLVVIIIVMMPFHAFLSTWGGTAIGPLLAWKSWKEVLLAVALICLLAWFLSHRGTLKLFLKDKLVVVFLLYVGLTVLDALFHIQQNGLVATSAGLASNLRFPTIFLVAYAVFRLSDVSYEYWSRRALQSLLIIGVFLAVFGILQVSVIPKDFLTLFGYEKGVTIAPFTLIDENPDARRAFATLRGPNDYGAFLILPLVASLMIALRRQWVWGVSGLLIIALFLSGSRSAWIGALVSMLVLAFVLLGRKAFKSSTVWLGAVSGFLVVFLAVYASVSIPAVRLAVFHSSPGDSSLTEGSTDAHWQATAQGIERVIAEPLGCGAGCSGPASYYGSNPKISENYYVQIAEETGVVGVGLFLAMLGLIAFRLHQFRSDTLAVLLLAAGVGIASIGILLHVWSDDPLSLVYFGLVGAVLGHHAAKRAGHPADKNVV